MLFSSISFIYYFLPLVLAVYYAVPKKAKNFVLLLASLIFYGCGEPRYLLLMLFTIAAGYSAGLFIGHFKSSPNISRIFLIACILLLAAVFGYYKYFDFLINNINVVTGLNLKIINTALPIGISFYMFQVLSYVTDVYRGGVKPQKNFITFAAYVSMFPQLIAGPIVRYSSVEKELAQREINTEKIYTGVRRFIIGLSKKILLANSFAELCDIYRASQGKSVLFCWIYAAAFMLFIYYDFSGYSDMAIGLGKMLGFKFPENFDYPYISRSITEFWRRWHMTLGGWFRDYVYIPLGGNRVPKLRWVFNVTVVWTLTGLWHGAAWNFVIWGIMFAVILAAEKLFLGKWLSKTHDVIKHIYVILLVLISFVIFNAENLAQASGDITGMFGAAGLAPVTAETLYYMRSYTVTFVLGIAGATPFVSKAVCRFKNLFKSDMLLSVMESAVLTALLLVCTSFLVDGSFNPFLYFRF